MANNSQPKKGVSASTIIVIITLIVIIVVFTVDFLICPSCNNNISTRVVDSYCSFDGHVTIFEYYMYDVYSGTSALLSTIIQ